MGQPDYKSWDRGKLVDEIKKLKKQKKYGLVWEDKPELVVEEYKEQLPVLKEIVTNEIKTSSTAPTNLLIEGDNYHALSVLNYTHRNKIDVIYIDPPYNTGNNSWKYNNKYIDQDDQFKHSKWVSFIHKRLKLAKKLLKDNGILCIAIDDNEVHNLIHILNDLFTSKEIITTVIEHNLRGNRGNNFSITHEYAIWVVDRNIDIITSLPELGSDVRRNLRKTGGDPNREDSPTMFYGIEVNAKSLKIVSVTKPLLLNEPIPKHKNSKTKMIWPIDSQGNQKRWYYGRNRIMDAARNKEVYAKIINGQIQIHYHQKGKPKKRKSVWSGSKYDSSTYGTELLTKIIGQNNFPYPKSIHTVKECIEAATNNKNAIILDFFGGSGTTGHAVLELNQNDGGGRKFILCTNNENNICTDICYSRIKNIIKGYSNDRDEKIKGLGSNLKYFKTDFVPRANTDKNKKKLMDQATEIICIKEDCFEHVKSSAHYRIFKNNSTHVAILYDDAAIDPFKKDIKKQHIPTTVYTFSLDEYDKKEEFQDVADLVRLKPVPFEIINAYRRIFR